MNTYFWFLAGTMTGFAAALVVMPLWRGAAAALTHRNVRIGAAAAGVIVFATSAIALYRTLGRPELIGASVITASPHPGTAGAKPGEPADSMESVVARLESRVARDGGKREDWLLLAQSYDFLGRAADAEHARKSAEDAGSAPNTSPPSSTASAAVTQPAASTESTAGLEGKVHANPRDTDAWRALAEVYRRDHAYEKAHDAFAKLQQLGAMTADTWADDADVLASVSGGSLRGDAARAIDRALALDARHPKALWLKASLAHEERRYKDALVVWKQLRSVLPADSSDVRIVEANIEEASRLAGTAIPAAAAASGVGSDVEVSGTVSIDRRLAARVPPGATLFIYAKAADSPGPPLAVLRQPAGTWPVTFHLDDTLAMIPTRRLSQFDKVVVEARVSSSGQATPSAGDLYVTSAVLKPAERKKLQLVISQEVG
jgi:cytochrome c-type biogenesis protein CcmH